MTTLYRAFDADNVLLYVGVTENLKKRQGQHRRSSDWFPDAARWTEDAYPERDAALTAERTAIATENPLYNDQGADHSACEHPRCLAKRAKAREKLRADIDRRVAELIAAAPPITDEQRQAAVAILGPVLRAQADRRRAEPVKRKSGAMAA